MKCESCSSRETEIEVPVNEGMEDGIWDTAPKGRPYRLCAECHSRLKNVALRPLELFNLVAIHGHSHYLSDDFYDYETGEATQPHIQVVDPNKFPFPEFEQVKDDLNRVVDFSVVQYFIENFVIQQLKKFDKIEVLKVIQERVEYNPAISYKAYEIVARVVGRTAEDWVRQQWENREENDLSIFAEPIAKCLPFEEAFEILTNELEGKDDKFLSRNVTALLYFQSGETLLWIEKVSSRIKNISADWGQLTASSQFTWEVADRWLTIGRPLSLVSLDALILCTTTGERQNQSLWIRELNPKLQGGPNPKVVADRLRDYLLTDSVPRTRGAVSQIIENIFETNSE